jgi:hypothetical protein
MDSQSRIIFLKFESIKSICNTIVCNTGNEFYSKMLKDIEDLECRYMIISAPIFCENKGFSEFMSVIKANNILTNITGYYEKIYYDFCKNRLALKKSILSSIKIMIENFPKSLLPNHADLDTFDVCPSCNNKMVVDKAKVSYYCQECGTIRELVGINFNETPCFGSNVLKVNQTNKGRRRNVHFQKWWRNILAQESDTEIGDSKDPNNKNGEKTIEAMKYLIKRDRRVVKMLTVNDIREMLDEAGLNSLYDHTSLILYKITGICPPTPSNELTDKVNDKFSKILDITEELRTEENINNKYNPYFIMKILDSILPEHDYANRRILFYIYIQKKDTIEKHDEEWQLLCKKMADPEIIYKPTERDFNLKYRAIR